MGIVLVGLYVACELIANVTASKPVQVGGLVVPAAIFIYAITFTLIDLINETFGKQGARRVILTAFLANLLLAAYVHGDGGSCESVTPAGGGRLAADPRGGRGPGRRKGRL